MRKGGKGRRGEGWRREGRAEIKTRRKKGGGRERRRGREGEGGKESEG